MAGSGAVLFGWLVLHLAGNLTAVLRRGGGFDGYAASLRAVWAAALGWCAARCCVASAAVHVAAAVRWRGAHGRARPGRGMRADGRARVHDRVAHACALGGALLLAFVVFHVLHLTIGSLHPDFSAGRVLPQPRERAGDGADGGASTSRRRRCSALHLFHGL